MESCGIKRPDVFPASGPGKTRDHSDWGHSFTRLFTVIRAVLWRKIDLLELLRSYGTAGGSIRMLAQPEQAYFPGFA
jgi:hypothetical protein